MARKNLRTVTYDAVMTRSPLSLLGCVLVLASSAAGCSGRQPILFGGGEQGPLPLLEATKKKATVELSSDAKDAVEANGFVIVPSSSAPSFHFGYSALFEKDQPVYITADAVLHALHASFDDILIDIEHGALIGELDAFLDETRQGLPKHAASNPQGRDESRQALPEQVDKPKSPPKSPPQVASLQTPQIRADVDLFLAVAKSLLHDSPAAPVAGASAERINELTQLAVAASEPRDVELFGTKMNIDFSMMKPRGHYTGSNQLKRYFRALSWLGRVELRIAEEFGNDEVQLNRGALAGTLLISELMTPRATAAWQRLDRAMQLLVGPADSMSLPQFSSAAKEMSLSWATIASIDSKAVVDKLQPISEQRINTQLLTPSHKTIPLWVFGQRYVADSHVMSATSYGKLPQKRMMPSALDVGAAVFGNPEAHKLLAPDYAKFSSLRPAVDSVSKQLTTMGPEL